MESQEKSKSTEATNQASELSDTANNSEQALATQRADNTVEKFGEKSELFLKGEIVISERRDISQANPSIDKNLGLVVDWLSRIYWGERDVSQENIKLAWQRTNKAWDFIKQLLAEKKNDDFQLQSANQKVRNLENQNWQITNDLETIKQEKETLERNLAELEASRNKLLAETASLKRNTGTDYDATSDRPHHHILTGEYKTLKEQHLDPLANRLFNVMLTTNPELKQQRKEKTNDIKAIISATVLMNGQAIMQGESIGSAQLPPEILNEMQSLLRQKLQLDDISPDTTELLKKAVNSARGKVEYPQPGNWQEKDYVKAGEELINSLDTELDTSLTPELKTEAQEAIKNALQFLERAALAEPPAKFSLEKEGVPFRSDHHEAAKGWDDEGTVIKIIYPVYLVNGEAKVKAVVLTEPSTENNFDSSSLMTVENTPDSTW